MLSCSLFILLEFVVSHEALSLLKMNKGITNDSDDNADDIRTGEQNSP